MGRHWDDMILAASIKLALMANPRVGGLEIRVRAVNGIVFLSGAVQDLEKRLIAEQTARMQGAFEVKNDIRVLSDSGQSANPGPIRATPLRSEIDLLLAKRIAGDLESDPRVNPYMLDVDVVGGIAYLHGVQIGDEQRSRAEEIARRVQGVLDVINDIEIRDGRRAA